ncbi:unnamed protein product, partial [Darwinula stevensoni]
IILGNQPVIFPHVASVQPCLWVSGKHNDLEELGVDTYHHTLFEILGNWSFGDYFKQEAIHWAWELLTEEYKLPTDCLYVTIFAGDTADGLQQDHEAIAIWANYLPKERILPFSKKDNFWEMGEQGPCGPCSEIHIDIRSEAERKAVPAAHLVNRDHPQVIEIWNLDFMQYNRLVSGKLVDLPHKHIDTGMGFERLAMVLQGKTSNYDTDVFTPLIEKLEILSGKNYNQNPTIDVAMRVIVDHVRAVVFSIADGQPPSNTKAGYVIRRILRRAIRYGYSHLEIQQPFMHKLVAVLVEQVAGVYPNLTMQQHYIEQLLSQLDQTKICHGVIDGQVAFELYDTHGFPLDLTLLIAKEQGLTIDEVGFQQALQQQKLRSQKDAATTQGDWQIVQKETHPCFVGYDQCIVTTSIVQWRTIANKRGKGGGQVADVGCMVSNNESIPIVDVQKEHELIVHTIPQLPTHLTGCIEARVDKVQRTLTANNHTATHLLQAALEAVLGDHVNQKGSFVTPTVLRFDFAHPTKLSLAQLHEVEAMVNQKIRENIPCVEQRTVPLDTAKAMGAQALFGEKYSADVRVITFDPNFSIELCGGTHVKTTGQIGFFKLLSETAVGTGIRRIEAITASSAKAFVTNQCTTLAAITTLLKQPKNVIKAVETLVYEINQLQKQVTAYQAKAIQQVADELQCHLEQINDIYLLVQEVQVPHATALRQIVFQYKAHYDKIFIVLAAKLADKAEIAMFVSDVLWQSDTKHAHDWIQSLAPLIGGSGGGQPFFATAGGNTPEGIKEVLKAAKELL